MNTLLRRAAVGLLAVLALACAAPAFAVDCTTTTTPNTAGTTANAQFEILQKLCAGVTAPAYSASDVTPVSGTLTATGQSASFTPLAGRPFNVSVQGTFVATCQLERQINSIWQPLTVSASGSVVQLYKWSSPASEIVVEPEFGIPYRINCTAYTSGAIPYKVSQ
jgi:hypothetical protein